MDRRQFLKAGTLSVPASAAGISAFVSAAADEPPKANFYRQPAADVPVVEEDDVVVCGGGPAGIAAAIAAARQKARVRLIDLHGFLGGVWTAGMVNHIIDYENKQGLIQEIMNELAATAAQVESRYFDVEAMKFVLEKLCVRSGVKLLYQSRVVAAVKNNANRATHIIVENRSGRQAFAAKVFIDTTGDGDVAAQLGCGFDRGHPESGKVQPMTMIALLGGIEYTRLNELKFARGGDVSIAMASAAMREELRRCGVTPSYRNPSLFRIREDFFALMANHEYNTSGITAQELTDATIHARCEIHAMVDALRTRGGVWKNIQLLGTSSQVGVREGRRIHGRYTVTRDDMINGARFDDGICRATFYVDIHALDPKHAGGAATSEGIKVKPYDIPLRSLIAKDVDGLMMAGRCISGDFFAHSSYRVTGNAAVMGEAAGKAAALAALGNRLPHEIKIAELRDK